ncbi:Na+/H+ antiporter [Paenibacillus qinlingensis]|uniref:CPA1 family monovalent cation:H+ antiporter n=1 Tax=Paenibacillus qinlingensis TaxID=1837343 RepID=A0ABU1NVQ1_9BACL|nr:Na+/H+ antiporter [Paenibacillus qinlingensis]MDR6551546.1 CPA1 family monovalent cation:H+ antiporter [Paenibacillus qinlingensis]
MELLVPLLIVAAVIVTASLLQKRYPQIPLPFYLIGLGAIVSWLPFLPTEFEFEPEAFMVCLIAPILFGDGRVISRKELLEYRKPIILMAIWLVVFTVIGIGYVIHYLIPAMPLPVAFALAAALSPTDAVAVKSMTRGRTFPKGLMAILEGESLLNDAAGLVSFKVALGVVMTGVFSAKSAALEFLLVALGGCLIGLVIGAALVNFRIFLRKRGLEEVHSLVTIQLITPFAIYLAAEELHVSGILAVVAAGIVHGLERDRLQQTTTKLHIISMNTWSMLSFILNGLVFALLGLLLPEVITGLLHSGEASVYKALGLALVIYAALGTARYLWVYFLHNDFLPANHASAKIDMNTNRKGYALAASLCGVHGTITLATALSIPFHLSDGTPFPLRNTILFISASVILISMLAASIAMPFIGNSTVAEADSAAMTMKEASIHLAKQTIQFLKTEMDAMNFDATLAVTKQLEEQIRIESYGSVKLSGSYIRELQQIGREAETTRLCELIDQGVISPQLQAVFMMLHKPQSESFFLARLQYLWVRFKLNLLNRKMKQHRREGIPERFRSVSEMFEELETIETQLQQAAVTAIRKQKSKKHKLEALLVIQHYSRMLKREKQRENECSEAEFLQQLRMTQLRSVQIRRDGVQELEEAEQISRGTVHELLQAINYEEMLILDSGGEESAPC